ncbi:ABC transporter permease subunit [Paenibacillus mendelii]|uniref:ABC transporter permease subunit n=1 Tax=Paenibacillus mendelii TaxID=206163 RepID=A0ABV6J4A8_9BACL|nr:ABC transporter permease subunit [Paenibacillus mendelii]MCQ6561763.1 ABC transporter permease subunit [Paenibacillus mendelii]
MLRMKLYKQRYLFLMLAPAFLLVLLFQYVPLVGWLLAFQRYQVGLGFWASEWVGFEQFKRFFLQSNDYVYLLRNTLSINVMMIVTNLSLGLIFAILLNEIRHKFFVKVIQTVSFFPFFISWVIIYSIANTFLSSSSGLLNELLMRWGIISDGLNILGENKYAWLLVVMLEAWKSVGYISIIFIAAISAIPTDQYEAADIDGATRFQKLKFITIPNLMPTFIVILILNSGWILNSNFELFFMFTNPTNWEKMEVLDMYIYKFGLQQLNYSYAAAVGIVKTIVSIVILLSVNAFSKKTTGKAIF